MTMVMLACFEILTTGYYRLVITLITLNFLRTGQILEVPADTFSKSISNAIQQPLATKMKLKKSDLNLNSYVYLNYFLVC